MVLWFTFVMTRSFLTQFCGFGYLTSWSLPRNYLTNQLPSTIPLTHLTTSLTTRELSTPGPACARPYCRVTSNIVFIFSIHASAST
ncbi:hypothetical protein BDR04DRAFT_236687 [Suillus decipiens]|nr:hypothetical protein BDR04DRAFT_236687 [Suillus decipiens]